MGHHHLVFIFVKHGHHAGNPCMGRLKGPHGERGNVLPVLQLPNSGTLRAHRHFFAKRMKNFRASKGREEPFLLSTGFKRDEDNSRCFLGKRRTCDRKSPDMEGTPGQMTAFCPSEKAGFHLPDSRYQSLHPSLDVLLQRDGTCQFHNAFL